jgi:homoserine O-acetyltransferase
MEEHTLRISNPLVLESGNILPDLTICYHTFGTFDSEKNNVIWVCHALTANSDVSDWWNGLFGHGKMYNQKEHFVVCANFIGSCYGTTGPLSINSITGKPYFREFPLITVRDLINAHEILRQHLKIDKIHTLIGGSIGGFQVFEWAVSHPKLFTNVIVIGSHVVAKPWNIAFNEAQRMAVESDNSYFSDIETGGAEGLKAARAMALISYRNETIYNAAQKETDPDKIDDFKVCSYQRYQGHKLAKRFNAYSYVSITKTYDSHNIGRKRGCIEVALRKIIANVLIISISSDLLFPPIEAETYIKYIERGEHQVIDSHYGHDGFLLEFDKISSIIKTFYLKYSL